MSVAPSQFDREEREIEFSRALAFSDGVFAFAITLLVTTIDVPKLTGADLEHQLLYRLDNLLPSIASYFLSFAIIGLLWLRHHRLFSRIRRLDTRALVLNLVVLAFVVLMPFTTDVIGRYGDLPAGVGIYALNIALAGLAFTALWFDCARRDMLGESLTRRQMRLELATRMSVPAGFLVSIPVAFAVSPGVAQGVWAVVIVGQRIVERRQVTEGRLPGRED